MNSLLDLLPKGGASIVDSLANEVKFFRRFLFLIQEAEEGIQHFLKGDLFHFDPHVGDTACHIRACYFSWVWMNRQEIFPSLKKDLTRLKTYAEKMTILMDQGSRNLHRSLRPCFLFEFLDRLNVVLNLESISLNVVASHLLSKYAGIDEKKMPQAIDESLLRKSTQDSEAFCAAFSRNLQRELSLVSVQFVTFLARNLNRNGQALHSLPTLLPSLLKQDSCGRYQLPCIAVFELISIFLRQTPIISCVWIVDFAQSKTRESFAFIPDPIGNWKSLPIDRLPAANPIFLVRAFSYMEKKENFLPWCLDLGIHNIFRWFGAIHPQYSGGPESLFPTDYQLFFEENLKSALFHQIGLASKNAETLSIKHISVCEKTTVLEKIRDLPAVFDQVKNPLFTPA